MEFFNKLLHRHSSGGVGSQSSSPNSLPNKASESPGQHKSEAQLTIKDAICAISSATINQVQQLTESRLTTGVQDEKLNSHETSPKLQTPNTKHDEEEEKFEDALENKLSLTLLAEDLEKVHLTTPGKLQPCVDGHEFIETVHHPAGSLDLSNSYLYESLENSEVIFDSSSKTYPNSPSNNKSIPYPVVETSITEETEDLKESSVDTCENKEVNKGCNSILNPDDERLITPLKYKMPVVVANIDLTLSSPDSPSSLPQTLTNTSVQEAYEFESKNLSSKINNTVPTSSDIFYSPVSSFSKEENSFVSSNVNIKIEKDYDFECVEPAIVDSPTDTEQSPEILEKVLLEDIVRTSFDKDIMDQTSSEIQDSEVHVVLGFSKLNIDEVSFNSSGPDLSFEKLESDLKTNTFDNTVESIGDGDSLFNNEISQGKRINDLTTKSDVTCYERHTFNESVTLENNVKELSMESLVYTENYAKKVVNEDGSEIALLERKQVLPINAGVSSPVCNKDCDLIKSENFMNESSMQSTVCLDSPSKEIVLEDVREKTLLEAKAVPIDITENKDYAVSPSLVCNVSPNSIKSENVVNDSSMQSSVCQENHSKEIMNEYNSKENFLRTNPVLTSLNSQDTHEEIKTDVSSLVCSFIPDSVKSESFVNQSGEIMIEDSKKEPLLEINEVLPIDITLNLDETIEAVGSSVVCSTKHDSVESSNFVNERSIESLVCQENMEKEIINEDGSMVSLLTTKLVLPSEARPNTPKEMKLGEESSLSNTDFVNESSMQASILQENLDKEVMVDDSRKKTLHETKQVLPIDMSENLNETIGSSLVCKTDLDTIRSESVINERSMESSVCPESCVTEVSIEVERKEIIQETKLVLPSEINVDIHGTVGSSPVKSEHLLNDGSMESSVCPESCVTEVSSGVEIKEILQETKLVLPSEINLDIHGNVDSSPVTSEHLLNDSSMKSSVCLENVGKEITEKVDRKETLLGTKPMLPVQLSHDINKSVETVESSPVCNTNSDSVKSADLISKSSIESSERIEILSKEIMNEASSKENCISGTIQVLPTEVSLEADETFIKTESSSISNIGPDSTEEGVVNKTIIESSMFIEHDSQQIINDADGRENPLETTHELPVKMCQDIHVVVKTVGSSSNNIKEHGSVIPGVYQPLSEVVANSIFTQNIIEKSEKFEVEPTTSVNNINSVQSDSSSPKDLLTSQNHESGIVNSPPEIYEESETKSETNSPPCSENESYKVNSSGSTDVLKIPSVLKKEDFSTENNDGSELGNSCLDLLSKSSLSASRKNLEEMEEKLWSKFTEPSRRVEPFLNCDANESAKSHSNVNISSESKMSFSIVSEVPSFCLPTYNGSNMTVLEKERNQAHEKHEDVLDHNLKTSEFLKTQSKEENITCVNQNQSDNILNSVVSNETSVVEFGSDNMNSDLLTNVSIHNISFESVDEISPVKKSSVSPGKKTQRNLKPSSPQSNKSSHSKISPKRNLMRDFQVPIRSPNMESCCEIFVKEDKQAELNHPPDFDERLAQEAANLSSHILSMSQDIQDSDSDADNNKTVITNDGSANNCENKTSMLPPVLVNLSTSSTPVSCKLKKFQESNEDYKFSRNDSMSVESYMQSMRSVLPAHLNQSEAGPITADELSTQDLQFQDGANLDLDFFNRVGNTDARIRASLTRDSLYVKFDPIVGAIVSKTVSDSFTMPPPSLPDQENNSEEQTNANETNQCGQGDAEKKTPARNSPALEAVQKLISLTPPSASANSIYENVYWGWCPYDRTPVGTPASATPKSASPSQDHLRKELKKLEDLMKEREAYFETELGKKQSEVEKAAALTESLKTRHAEREAELKAAVERELRLKKEVHERTKSKQQLSLVMEEYEKTISQLVAQKEEEKKESEVQKELLIKERDTAMQHLNNMEIAFNDVHQKYERSKTVIEGMKTNENLLKKSLEEYDEAVKASHAKYDTLKTHAIKQLDTANQELDVMRRTHKAEIDKLKVMLKKSELRVKYLEETLEQKCKENQELTAICDELINKVDTNN